MDADDNKITFEFLEIRPVFSVLCLRANQPVNHNDFKYDQFELILFLTVRGRSILRNQISLVNFDKVFITGILYRNLIGGELIRKR